MQTTQRINLKAVLNSNIKLPMCPAIFSRLNTALLDPQQHLEHLSELLSSDPSLTIKVLKAVNSAYYGLPRSIRSIDEAILRIGFNDIWSIAAAAKGRELFAVEEWKAFGAYLWEHSVKAGVFARAVSRYCTSQMIHDAHFTSGMLHDFGKLVLAQLDKAYVPLCNNGALHGKELTVREVEAYGIDHVDLGVAILRHWKLPEVTIKPISRQHEKPSLESPRSTDNILPLANRLAHAVVAYNVGGKMMLDLNVPRFIVEDMGLSHEQFVMITGESQRQILTMLCV
jgi:HD-like signal output (HDOD) protein